MKKYLKVLVLLSILLISNISVADNPSLDNSPSRLTTKSEIRKIMPPNFDESHLGERMLCHRPGRNGSPKMNVILEDDKIIANNYGHGGGGWTLAPGVAKYVVAMLDQKVIEKKFSKDENITIIGAGVIGLFNAVELLNVGYKNITIVAESFDGLASNNAGGLLSPLSMDFDEEFKPLMKQTGLDAYKFYESIALKKHPFLKEGASLMPAYFENRNDSGLEEYVGEVMQPAKDIIIDFGNGTRKNMVAYDDAIFMDTGKMMILLKEYLKNKVQFKQQKIESFSQINDKIIVNCSGLGAKLLAHDQEMLSIQGHLIMLKDQNPSDIGYMMSIHMEKNATTKSGMKVKRKFYIFPKHKNNTNSRDVGVIGGTFIEGADKNTPNNEEFEIIINNAKKFYGIEK